MLLGDNPHPAVIRQKHCRISMSEVYDPAKCRRLALKDLIEKDLAMSPEGTISGKLRGSTSVRCTPKTGDRGCKKRGSFARSDERRLSKNESPHRADGFGCRRHRHVRHERAPRVADIKDCHGGYGVESNRSFQSSGIRRSTRCPWGARSRTRRHRSHRMDRASPRSFPSSPDPFAITTLKSPP